jgi:hypothetical protein
MGRMSVRGGRGRATLVLMVGGRLDGASAMQLEREELKMIGRHSIFICGQKRVVGPIWHI